MEYVHFNPVKHGHVVRAEDGPTSTLPRSIEAGIYSKSWAESVAMGEVAGAD